jgi:hypothetical protein
MNHGVNLNTTYVSEHVPDIERQIRLIKERARALRSTLPFKIIPGRMIEMLANVVLWINVFPPSNEVSASYSPCTIMTGTALDFNKHCQIPFGAYAEVHEDRNIMNTMDERTQPAICLGPTANFQGSYIFLSLRMGKRITRKQFKELPMPASIIKRVEAMAIKEKQDKTITFHDRSGAPITDLYDSPDDETAEAAAGVDNDNGNADNDNVNPDEAPGIAIEQHHSDSDDDGTMNGDITGVTTENGDIIGVTTEDGEVTGVTTAESTVTGVTTKTGGITGVNTETTGVLLNDDEAPTSGTEDHPGTPGVAHECTAATEPVSNNADNPPPLGPPTSDDDSDSDDEDNDAAENNDGIEAHRSEIPNEEVYHSDTMTPSVQ